MKKALTVIIAALMIASAFAVSAAAAENTNHYIEIDYPTLYKDEKTWQVYGWTVVDTEIISVGYKFDDGETVWAVPEVDVRDDNSRIEDTDAFRDHALEAAIVEYDLTNGLTDFFAYRIMLTLDLTETASGKHTVEVIAKYADGDEENPFRGEIFSFKKKSGPASAVTEAPVTEAPATEPAATEPVTEKATEPAAEPTQAATEKAPAETEEKTAGSGKNNTLVIILIVAIAVAAFVVGALLILKKKKK